MNQEETKAPRRATAIEEGEPIETPPSGLQLTLSALMGLFVVLPGFLGGGSTPLVAGLSLGALGVLMILRPATHTPGFWVNLCLAGLILWGATAFLPVSWFPIPGWRTEVSEMGVSTGSLWSAQPWVSLETLAVLLSGIIWFSYAQGKLWHDKERRMVLAFIGLGVAFTAAAALYGKHTGQRISFWSVPGISDENYFGPFPNRNHFAAFLAIGAVITAAFAWELKRRSPLATVISAGLLLMLLYTAAQNKSRAGIILLTLGVVLWFFLIAIQMGSLRRVVIAGVVLGLLIATFSALGGTAVNRLGEGFASDFRSKVWSDSIRLLANQSIFGVGLGNFEPVFAVNQVYSGGEHRVTNPESSALWLAVETGLPGLFLAGVAAALCLASARTLKRGRKSRLSNRRFRAAALVAGLIVIIHSFVDTPLHTYGVALPVLLCLGLARTQRERGLPKPGAVLLSRLSGVALVLLAAFWLGTTLLGWRLPGKTGARASYITDFTSDRVDTPRKAMRDIDRSIRWEPLHWSYYFAKAHLTLLRNGSLTQALDDFRKARFLAADIPWVPYEEVRLWIAFHPPYAISAMREVLNRDKMRLSENYGNFLQMAGPFPALMANVRSLSRMNNTLRFLALPNADAKEIQTIVQEIMLEDPELTGLSSRQRQQFFETWAKKGDPKEVLKILHENPAWQEDGWRVLADDLAQKGNFEEASKLARIRLPSSGLPLPPPGKTIRELDRDARLNPTNFLLGVSLMKAQSDSLQPAAALATLETVSQLPDATGFLQRERADLFYDLKRYKEAWENYQKWDADPLSKK